MAKKSKSPQKKPHPRARLTANAVLQIRKDYATGKASMPELAEKHGVGTSVVSSIVNRRTWKSLPDAQKGKWHPPKNKRRPRRAHEGRATRLTREQADEIRALYAKSKGRVTQGQLAARYGISSPAVSSIINNRTHASKRALVKIPRSEYPTILRKFQRANATVTKLASEYDVSYPAMHRIVRLAQEAAVA